MDGLVCGWEESSVNIEGKATLFWYRNPIAVIPYVLGYAPFKDHLSYAPGKQMYGSGKCICAEMWTGDWWWKTQASFLVWLERLFLVRFLLCLGELECQREHVREIMSERLCQRERVREIVSERACQRHCVREIVSERLCQRDCGRDIVSERLYQRDCVREIVAESMSGSVSESLSKSLSESLSESVSESLSESLSESVSESLSESVRVILS